MAVELLPEGYDALITDLKVRIRQAQVKASRSVNRELIALYWQVGKTLLERQAQSAWGDRVLERLSTDLKREFPEMHGFSKTNLKYMRRFAEAYPQIGQQAVDQLPWGHNIVLLTRLKDSSSRDWYAHACIEHGWSRAVLEAQIETPGCMNVRVRPKATSAARCPCRSPNSPSRHSKTPTPSTS